MLTNVYIVPGVQMYVRTYAFTFVQLQGYTRKIRIQPHTSKARLE